MMNTMWTMKQASEYLEIPVSYLRHQIKHGLGPSFVSPSERTKFFTKDGLDAWKATWRVVDKGVSA